MKITAMTTAVLMAGGLAHAHSRAAAEREVTACMEDTDSPLLPGAVTKARMLVSEMFHRIGVKIAWQRRIGNCPFQGIVISLSYDTPATLQPGALASALPYEGTHIRVFYDRILDSRCRRLVPTLLAHVLVHEITHMLQGISRHSPSGLMKAQWSQDDFARMMSRPLPFENSDIALIYRGLAHRMLVVSAANRGPMRAGN